jgi:hypothetical protein
MREVVHCLTPIQIALLALASETHARSSTECVAVWGSWQKAAAQLTPAALLSLGTERGTRELEYTTLHGRHRRGKAGRLVHCYRLTDRALELGARCAWAVAHKPKDRLHVTWKDVPAEVPRAPAGHRCAACGCTPDKPCTINLPDGCGEGNCVPAGTYGFKRCTACQLKETA